MLHTFPDLASKIAAAIAEIERYLVNEKLLANQAATLAAIRDKEIAELNKLTIRLEALRIDLTAGEQKKPAEQAMQKSPT